MTMSAAMFRHYLKTTFRIEHAEGPIPLTLAKVTEERAAGGFRHFSIFFHGPADRLLPQGIYALQQDTVGSLDLFIVPVIGSNRERIIYEACFSQAIEEDVVRENADAR